MKPFVRVLPQTNHAKKTGRILFYLIFFITSALALVGSIGTSPYVGLLFLVFSIISFYYIKLSRDDIMSPPAIVFFLGVICFTVPFIFLIN